MLLNEIFLDHLTPEEKIRYEDLFVIRQEAKDVMKVFRKQYNTLKGSVAKLEKKYGKSSEYIHNGPRLGTQDRTVNNVLGHILMIENKYSAIEHSLRLSKERQKYFTILLHKFPFDSIRQRGSASSKIDALKYFITSARDKILEAGSDVRIANKYLASITQSLNWDKERELYNKKE